MKTLPVAAAIVSTEDHRFYSEPGFDPIAIGRVIAGRVTGQPDQGGATLYQQLAKMLYTPGQSGARVEAEQVVLGIKLDLSYSKPQILRLYSDVAYFGHGYYGLAEASCGYFGVTPAGLSWAQAALLAGLVQAPTADNPVAHYTVARAREAHVLGRLAATGALSRARSDSVGVSAGPVGYVVGGYDGTNPSSLDPQVLATRDGQHFRVAARLPVPVRYAAAAAADGLIWVFGGQTGSGATDVIQRIDPATGAATVAGHLPRPVQGAAAISLDGRIYVAGGAGASRTAADGCPDGACGPGAAPVPASPAGDIRHTNLR